jgi:uncharacterized protein YcnI
MAPAAAQAHISLHPNAVPAGANATLEIRVPNEMDNARTTKLAVEFPPGFLDVSTAPPPGWTATVHTTKLATPVKTDEGTITTQVHEVDWTAPKSAGIPPGQFLNFPIWVVVPGRTGQKLTFKAVQGYSNGQVVRWIGPPGADTPAPWIIVTPKGGVVQDVAGGEAGPESLPVAQSTGHTTVITKKSSSNGLAVVALIVAILGVAAGVAALILARRMGHVTAR